ncbi:MAG: hypothetical protein IT459_06725 [Planctomycetes bacterium]|nr:hypothetical protein [Planctomycetota bacterium]
MKRTTKVNKSALFELVGYTPHAGQWEVHNSTASRRIVACGVRWGKSTCAAMECVAALLDPAHARLGWVVAPTYDLTQRVHLAVLQVFRTSLKHRLKEYAERDRMIVVRNLGGGLSRLQARSADNPTSLLGEGLDFLIVDEAARLDRGVWDGHLSQRLLDRRGWALLISTPRGPNWFGQMVRRAERGEPNFRAWVSPSWENPMLDRSLIEEERRLLPKDAFEQEYEAAFVGAQNEVCFVCGGPDPAVPGVVLVKSGRELPRCRNCNEWTDLAGHSIVSRNPNGRPRLKRIILPDDGEPDPFVHLPPSSLLDSLKQELDARESARG